MNDNTVLRIKVPAHLYESVKEQLTLKEAKGVKAFGDWKVVKEKKLPKKGMEKVEEVGGFPSTAMGIDVVDTPGGIVTKEAKKPKSLDELKAIKEKLEKKIHEMENTPKKEKEEIKEFVGINPQDYDWITALGLSLPAIVAMLRLGADKLGSEVYAKLQKAKEYLEKKGSEEPVEEAKEKKEEDK